MQRVLIWDIPTRLFHWLLAAGFLTAFVIAQFGGKRGALFPYHSMLGIVVGVMVLLRVLWGIIGTRHARFGSFLFGPGAVIEYLKGVVTGHGRKHVGHNPASSYAIFAMLGLVLVIVASGLLMSRGNEAFEEIHSIAVYVLLGVVAVHVIGVVIHTLRYRENITVSMVTGTKEAEQSQAIRSSAPLSGGLAVLVIALIAFGLQRNYDPARRQTTLPLIGTMIQLGEEGKDRGGAAKDRRHDDDD